MEGRGSSGHSYSDLMSNSSDVTNGAMVMARNKYGFPQMPSLLLLLTLHIVPAGGLLKNLSSRVWIDEV